MNELASTCALAVLSATALCFADSQRKRYKMDWIYTQMHAPHCQALPHNLNPTEELLARSWRQHMKPKPVCLVLVRPEAVNATPSVMLQQSVCSCITAGI